MAAKQFIRPEIIFVFIRVHSWLKTFLPSGQKAELFFATLASFGAPG